MKQSILKWLSISFLLLVFNSCSKKNIYKMEKGKYHMVHICNLPSGIMDTFELDVYGPTVDGFYPAIDDDNVGRIEIYEIDKKSRQKRHELIKIYLNTTIIPYDGYFFGNITDYEVQKRGLVLDYVGKNKTISGKIQLKWVQL